MDLLNIKKIASRTISVGLICLFAVLTGCSSPPEGMIQIQAGEFIMGSDEVDREAKAIQYGNKKPWYLNEHPAHKVTLKEFYIDKHEVTNREYSEFVKAKNHKAPPHWKDGSYKSGKDNYPAHSMSWFSAKDYCQWKGKRLPTEAEWEKAARGTDGRRFPWGDEFDSKKLNTFGEYGGTSAVGTFKNGASPYGLLDMAGNVQEWVEDSYRPYPGSDYKDEDFEGDFKVVRGGGWGGIGHYASNVYVRTSQRNYAVPGGIYDDVGLRCAW